MKNNKLENYITIIILMRSIYLLMYKQVSFMDTILAVIVGFILIYIYQKYKLQQYKIMQIITIISIIAFLMPFLKFASFYIKDNIINNTPIEIIYITLITISLYLSLKNTHIYFMVIELSSYIIILYSIISTILIIPFFNLRHLTNLLTINISSKSLYLGFLILFIYALLTYIKPIKKYYKSSIIGLCNILLIKTFTTIILGKNLENIYQYPYISIFKKIKYYDFLERLEVFLSIQYLFDFFAIATLCLITIRIIIFKILKKDKFIKKTYQIIQ